MTEAELIIPAVPPLGVDVLRPRWSVMVPAYNAASTIRQTLDSVLATGFSAEEMQIAVIDNNSTDSTAEVVEAVNRGGSDVKTRTPARVEVHRNSQNLGVVGNWNACLERAHGEFVHLLHADDYVTPGFYDAVERAFAAKPEADLCLVRSLIVDEHGEPERLAKRFGNTGDSLPVQALAYGNEFYAPGVVVRRATYEKLGGFSASLACVPDWEMWLRILAQGVGVYVNDPLACYRQTRGNLTNRFSRTAEDLRELIRFGPLVARRSPGFERRYWREFLRTHAAWSVNNWELAGDADAHRVNLSLWKKLATPGQRLDLALRKVNVFASAAERRLRRGIKRITGRKA